MGAGFFHQAIVWPGVPADQTLASYLLTGETDGFAINAISASQTPAYVGASYAGSVSVKDTGTPANNLTNVALDASNLTNSGTSPKMVPWNSAPYLRWTPHNYALQSQTFETGWTTNNSVTVGTNADAAPDGTSTAESLTPANGGPNVSYINSTATITLVSGFTYTASVYVKANGYNYAQVLLYDGTNYSGTVFSLIDGTYQGDRSGGTASINPTNGESAGSGWYRISVTFTATNTSGQIQIHVGDTASSLINTTGVTGNGTSGILMWGAQLVRGYNANPYLVTTSAARIGIPQAYDTAASKYGILVEPAATNLALRSEDFSTTWAQTDTTRTSTNNSAPDSSSTATLMTEGSAGTATNKQAITITANATYTISVFLKKGNTNFIRLGLFETATTTNRIDNWFNLNTGAMGTPANGGTGSGATGTITSIDGSWYRCTLTGAVGNGATAVTLDMSSASADGSATRVNAATYYVWGGQAETGSVATSYIPTLGSTVTRAADVLRATAGTFPISASTYSLFAWAKTNTFTNISVIGYNDGTTTNDVAIYEASSTVLNLYNAGSMDVAAGNYVVGTPYKVAGRVASNDGRGAVGGTLGSQDTTVTPEAGCDRLSFGSNPNGSTIANVWIYQAIFVPRAYNDAELQSKTT